MPDYITNLTNLKTLNIYKTNIKELPNFMNHKIEYIFMDYELYQTLPDDIKNKRGTKIAAIDYIKGIKINC